MRVKHFLCASAAVFSFASAAQAADAIVAPEPEAVEYVRVCDAYGAGYFYIPGTETCLRIHGYIRYDITGGDDVYAKTLAKRERDTYDMTSRFELSLSTASETDLGTLKTYADARFDWNNGVSGASGELRYAYIQLGGLRLGLDESAFVTFTGYLGDVINDDVILAGGTRTNAISYTFKGGNGFSAIIALEQGQAANSDFNKSVLIDDYMPYVVGGLKLAQDWGSIAGVAAYDALNEEWMGKVRLDVNVTDQLSVWAQGAYKSNDDHYIAGVRQIDSFYGTWGGDWAVWGGAKYKINKKAAFNIQAAYEEAGRFAGTMNVAYTLVPGFTVTPEISYTKWNDDRSVLKGKDAIQGMVRFQRSF
ncbi:porin [Ochrobactrum sp. Marseille-Q0166]|uniref:porin n=1 Tax=Ochrobactrum sp. Marseille-Q0166 TaxID=2761105 RepID=UPI0016556FCB|nr:porin [Ochrobactrum sp. Marseille-Q0166]MBC8717970.1 porin [Ochrobactrum sp. Marseille-Q0166]